ncbi:MAG: hypothetical protein ABFS56_22110 [Pseudomonadota bacterium]
MSIEQQVEEFARRVIDFHGFRFNDSFSCLIPDTEPFPTQEGLYLWGYSSKRQRIETKIEKFHTATRIGRMEEMVNVPEKDYRKTFASSILTYLKALKGLGFNEIGKGVLLFGSKTKVYNVQASAKLFENNLEALKEFEKLTLNNPILKFAEDLGYFEVKNRDKLVFDSYFGGRSEPVKKPAKKAYVKKEKAKAQAQAQAQPQPQPKAQKPRLLSSTPLADKLKKIAAIQPDSSLDGEAKKNAWSKQVNALYKKVQTWLSDHAKSGYISFDITPIKLAEENLGHYEIDSLELDLVGGHQIIFQPVEMNILGAIGRIDVYHRGYSPHKVMLLLVDEGKNKLTWKLWKSLKKGDQQAFSKDTFEGLLNHWIE